MTDQIDPKLKWDNLRNQSESDDVVGFPTTPLDIKTPHGFLRLALGTNGEARLLVPISARDKLRDRFKGQNLLVEDSYFQVGSSNIRFLDIQCLDRTHESSYSDVVKNIARRISEMETPLKAVDDSIREFRELFKVARIEVSIEKAIGLLGELVVLRELFKYSSNSWQSWFGPDGARHDFRAGDVALEVKSSLRAHKPVVEINALDQLAAPEGGSLYLTHLIFEQDKNGAFEVSELADGLLAMTSDPAKLEAKLQLVDFDPANCDAWKKFRFSMKSDVCYQVEGGFPRLTNTSLVNGNLPDGVSHLRYNIDLSVAKEHSITGGEYAEVLESLSR